MTAAAPAGAPPAPPRPHSGAVRRSGGAGVRTAALCGGVLALCAALWLSLYIGAGHLSPSEVSAALRGEGSADAITVVRDMRLTRGLTAALVGLALGVAGAVMQALIGNPLADPGLLGVNAGAGLGIVVAVGLLGLVGFDAYVWFALGCALLVSAFVYAVSSTVGRGSPFTVVLSGVAVSAVLMGVTNALSLFDPTRFNALRTWMSGSVAGRDASVLLPGAALILCGLITAALIARPLAQLGLGDDTARALGVPVGATKLGAALAVMLLAGTATALGGPILFVGLMVPHLARAIAGHRIGWVLALSGVSGALLVVIADVAGRVVAPPGEAPAGILTALIGAPVLALLARGRDGGAR